MSVFSEAELEYLRGGRRLGRVATVGADGTPHVVPVGWSLSAGLDAIEVSGHDFAQTKKFRDVLREGRAAIVIDDLASTNPWRPRGIEVRGDADAVDGPRPLIRIRPRRIVSWGLGEGRSARTISPSANGRANGDRPQLVGINHVALEVDDLEAALAFYGEIFDVVLRGRSPGMAFIDIGDQFVALAEGRTGPRDGRRHFGLVVDDRDATRRALERAGAEILPGRGLTFFDPSGNQVQVVQYDEIQFTKAPTVLRGMGLTGLGKTAAAREELRGKGLG